MIDTKLRYSDVKNIDDACEMASQLYDAEGDGEGTPAECFIAGWTNAMDMIDAGTLNRDDHAEVLYYVFHDFKNMGHDMNQIGKVGR